MYLGQRYPISGSPAVAASCARCLWSLSSGLSSVGALQTAVNSIHLVDEPPMATGIDCGELNLFMCVWGYYYRMVSGGLLFSVPPVKYQGPLCMSFGRYFVGHCLVFLLVMYLGAVYLLFGWYSIGCFDSFTWLLWFGYHDVDCFTLAIYYTWSISIVFYCYPMIHASLPVACEADRLEIRLWRSRSYSSSGM